jgi:hypothetical protein
MSKKEKHRLVILKPFCFQRPSAFKDLLLSKGLLLSKDYIEAVKKIKELNRRTDKSQLLDALKITWEAEKAKRKSGGKPGKSVRWLPQYKPQADTVREYYTVGHDHAHSMYHPLLEKNSTDEETIAFFFAGIGDARHLLQTMIAIAKFESARRSQRKFHFTINNIKKEVFARDLIFFFLLDQLAAEMRSPEKRKGEKTHKSS